MNKHQIAFFKSVGFTQAMIDALIAIKEEDASPDLSAQATAFRESQIKVFENDAELVAKIAGAEKGKVTDIITRKLKSTFGFSAEEIKDKTVEELIAIAKVKATANVDKPLKDLEEQLLAANNKIKDYEENILPGEKKKSEEHIKGFKIENMISKMVDRGEDLRLPLDDAIILMNGKIGTLYDRDINDKGELVFYQKGTKLQAKSADGTKVLTAKDIIDAEMEKSQIIKKSNAEDIDPATGKKRVVVVVEDPNKNKAGISKNIHANKAQEALDEIKKLDEAAAAEAKK